MPLLKLTPYECEHDLLPRLCGKCGEAADQRIRFIPLPPALNILMGFMLIACPPLFIAMAMICYRRITPIFMPMCDVHRADWEWRDRLTSITYLAFVTGAYCVAVPVLL